MARPNSYEAIVERYRWRERLKLIELLEYFEKLPSLDEAIEAAADGRKENGALHNHQRLLEQPTVDDVRRVLLANRAVIGQVTNFEELFKLFNVLLTPVGGAGEMYIYDAALRIGAHLKKLPEHVYLHKGSRIGAEALGVAVARRVWIAIEELPDAFHILKAYELEDLLCIYKDHLRRVRRQLEQRLR